MPRKPKRSNVNAKGRNSGEGQYMTLSYNMVRSEAFRSLSGTAVKVWIEIRSSYNSKNNGKLFLSLTDAARRLSISKSTASRAFKELEEKGFLKLTRKGFFTGRQASEYISTDLSFNGQLKTNDWKQWRKPPKKNRTQVSRRNKSPPDSATSKPKEISQSHHDTRQSNLRVVHSAK